MADHGTALDSVWQAQSELPVLHDNLVEEIDEVEERGRIGKYEILRMLGEGEFATVWECRAHNSKSTMAIKAIKKSKVQRHACLLKSKRNIRRVNMEILAMKTCSHMGICHLFDTMQSKTKVYLIMEIGERDLFSFIDDFSEGCPEIIVKQIMRILALALRHCHRRGIAHRDIKPENILICGRPDDWLKNGDAGIIKLCDFGLCAKIETGVLLTDFVGSPGFFAPELMTRRQYNGALADAWSLGAVLIELCLGHNGFNAVFCPPYERLHDVNGFAAGIYAAVHRLKFGGEYFVRIDSDSESDNDNNTQNPSESSLYTTTTTKEPSEETHERRVIKLSTPVLQLLDKLLQIEPERRSTVEQICTARWFELLRIAPDGFSRLLRLTLDLSPTDPDDLPLRRTALRETPKRADNREFYPPPEKVSSELDDFSEVGADGDDDIIMTDDPTLMHSVTPHLKIPSLINVAAAADR